MKLIISPLSNPFENPTTPSTCTGQCKIDNNLNCNFEKTVEMPESKGEQRRLI